MTRQYVRCKFHESDRRDYTYHHEGKPLIKGDKVLVDSPRGQQTVTVVGFIAAKPTFETKPILRKVADAPLVPTPHQRTLL